MGFLSLAVERQRLLQAAGLPANAHVFGSAEGFVTPLTKAEVAAGVEQIQAAIKQQRSEEE
jgi:hypothetical protein